MVASRRTIGDAADVVLRHLPKEAALDLLRELRAVPGNASFAATLAAIEVEVLAVPEVPQDLAPRDLPPHPGDVPLRSRP